MPQTPVPPQLDLGRAATVAHDYPGLPSDLLRIAIDEIEHLRAAAGARTPGQRPAIVERFARVENAAAKIDAIEEELANLRLRVAVLEKHAGHDTPHGDLDGLLERVARLEMPKDAA